MTVMDSMEGVMLTMVLMLAVSMDLTSSRIPNWLTFPAMGFALAGHAWLNGIDGIFFSLAGLGTGLGLFLFIYLAGGIGAGDVKLMASIGAFVGVFGVLSCALMAILIGGLYAIGAMGYQWGVASAGQRLIYAAYGAVTIGGSAAWSRELALPFKLRYGLAIAAGTLLYQLGIHPFEG
jgi:prepilin peptidase CpaA